MGIINQITGGVCTGPGTPGDDGVTVYGPAVSTEIIQRVFDFRDAPQNTLDECVDSVNGAVLRVAGCLFIGGIKAVLCGNGDAPINDIRYGRVEFEDCVFIDCGRRCPEAQDGVTVTMRRCWVHGWGQRFDTRAFGAWANRYGTIIAEDCIFTQPFSNRFGLGLWRSCSDIAHHIGQAVNDLGFAALLRSRSYLPGTCRGLTADTGGRVLATRCWRNRPWIRIDNCKKFVGLADALDIVQQIDRAMPPAAFQRLNIPSALGLVGYFSSVVR